MKQVHIQPFGRDQRNLLYMPIGVAGKNQPVDSKSKEPVKELIHEIDVFDADIGDKVKKQLMIRTSSKHDFCTGYEIGILIGLLTLHYLKDGFANPKVNFTNEELYELMHWTKGSGRNNERLQIGLDRINGTKLTFYNMWSADGGKTYEKTFSTGILDSYEFVKSSNGRGRSWIRWSDNVYSDIKSGNLKPLNTDEFYQLKKPQVQYAYRIIDDAFQRSDRFEMQLEEFAARVGIASRQMGRVRERVLKEIDPKLYELESFVKPANANTRFAGKRGNWKIIYEKAVDRQVIADLGNNALKLASFGRVEASSHDEQAMELVCSFYSRYKSLKNWIPSQTQIKDARRELLEHFPMELCLEALDTSIRNWKKSGYVPAQFKGAIHSIKEECLRSRQQSESKPSQPPNIEPETDDTKIERAKQTATAIDRFNRLDKEQKSQFYDYASSILQSDYEQRKIKTARAENTIPVSLRSVLRQWMEDHNSMHS